MPLFERVLEKYPKQVKLVFKNYPLRDHEFAGKAAIAALAAHRQGKFWEFHDLLFDNFDRLSDQVIRELLQDVDLDLERVEKDLRDPKLLPMIDRDVSDGIMAGVTGTPTIFINGRFLRNWTPEGFQAAIEKELKRVM